MIVRVHVRGRRGIADPQGATLANALRDLGFEGVGEVRVDKEISIELDAPDVATAEEQAVEMCERLLANPVMEDYVVVVEP